MKEIEFDLLKEPWIRVLKPDCTVAEVSLTDALLCAQEYTDLAGELPTQDVAVLRLLLAVLHTVFSRMDEEGNEAPFHSARDALLRWKNLWQLGHFPQKPVRAYLAQWKDRFWLFHPQRPFWQVPEAKIGTEYTAAKLNGELSESGNKARLFPAYAGTGKAEMTYAQAARWLLYINGFDDTSAKPKKKGLPSVGAGWLGKLGLIQAQGSNLFETLMLNLVLLKDDGTLWGEPRPCWELDNPHSAERTEIDQPENQAELLTLQSRRLLLQRDHNRVTGYELLGGDFFNKENTFCEQMTVWRKAPEKKNMPAIYTPKRHDPSKQLWREFPAVFVPQPNTHTPGVVNWITRLQNPHIRCLDRKVVVHFRITSVVYGDKDSSVNDTFSDMLSFHGFLLDELGKSLRAAVVEEIDRCNQLAKAVGKLANDLDIAAGGSKMSAHQRAQERFYYIIDQPFREWLYSIDPDQDQDQHARSQDVWQAQAKKAARDLGNQMVQQAGSVAFAGRTIEDKGSGIKRHYAAPELFNRFLREINQIYPGKESV